MARIPVFFSFHFDNDMMRVQQVRNMGALDGNEPVGKNEWETVRAGRDPAIKKWIDETMRYKRCVVVLVGSETAHRPWVRYEIEKAWKDGKGVVGIHIHNLNCPNSGTCRKGPSPFDYVRLSDGRTLSSLVTCYDPLAMYAYSDIQDRLPSLVQEAIDRRAFQSGAIG